MRPTARVATARDRTAAVEIAIGPEGGFDPEELEAFRVAGFEVRGLGPRVLRTETAAIAALAWLQSRYGDLKTARSSRTLETARLQVMTEVSSAIICSSRGRSGMSGVSLTMRT